MKLRILSVIFIQSYLVLEILSDSDPDQMNSADRYLTKYGYTEAATMDRNPRISPLTGQEKIKVAIQMFQRMAGLNVTGTLNNKTLEIMKMDRCGVHDVITLDDVTARRRKRYITQGTKWRSNYLTYYIKNYSPDFPKRVQQQEIIRAFKLWSDVANLYFTQVNRAFDADIEIKFATGSHGDGHPFDGPGGTLAHAFFPVSGGDVHLDDDEEYSAHDPDRRKTDLFQVLAHEIGHSLGLQHTNVWTAVMRPFKHPYDPYFRLDQDDIDGIQALYGRRLYRRLGESSSKPTITTTTHSTTLLTTLKSQIHQTTKVSLPPTPSCLDGQFDAVTMIESARGEVSTVMFRRNMYSKVNNLGLADGNYVRYIDEDFPDLPIHLDAALYVHGHPKYHGTYFFKHDGCWLYRRSALVAGYPMAISERFPGIPDDLDAAFVWSGNNAIYFIKDQQYFRFDAEAGRLAEGYPRPLNRWQGLPNHIDAAFQWQNGRTYFFTGYRYTRFDDNKFSVERGYPLSSHVWLACDETATAKPTQKPRAPNNSGLGLNFDIQHFIPCMFSYIFMYRFN